MVKKALYKVAFHGSLTNIWSSLMTIPEVISHHMGHFAQGVHLGGGICHSNKLGMTLFSSTWKEGQFCLQLVISHKIPCQSGGRIHLFLYCTLNVL
jgi:hypothetical protein